MRAFVLVLALLAACDDLTSKSPIVPDGARRPETTAVFRGDAHDERERYITVHRLGGGACVALFKEGSSAPAMAAIPCPSTEKP